MKEFAIGGAMFLALAFVGLICLIVGIIFLIKNIKWKETKDRQGQKSLSNVIGMICFSMLIFIGGMWLLCFGIAAVSFFIISAV